MENIWNEKIMPSPVARLMGDKYQPDQLLLFQVPDHNRHEYSEAFEIFDLVPWFIPRAPSEYAIDKTGNKYLPPIERNFRIKIDKNEYEATIAISPVQIKGKKEDKGKYLSKYPGLRENNVEKALRKLATLSDRSYFDRNTLTVQFHFSELQKVLMEMGLNYYVWQITEAMEILAKSNIDLKIAGDQGFVGSIIEYGRIESKKIYVVKFCSMYTEALIERSFVLYNNTKYGRLSSAKNSALTQWIFMVLSIRYKNASKDSPYDFHLKSVMRDSPMNNKDASKMYANLVESLNFLKSEGILSDVIEGEKIFESRTLVNAKITVYAGDSLIQDTKKRLHRKKIVDGVLPIDYNDDPVVKDPKQLKGMIESSRAKAKEIGIDLDPKADLDQSKR